MEHEIDDPGARHSIAFEIAAGQFHQIKNRAHSGLSALARVSDELRALGVRRDLLNRVDHARDCFQEIIQHCSALNRERDSEPEPSDLNVIVRSAVEMLRGPLKQIRLVETYADLPLLRLSRFEIREIILSLLLNAVQAIKDKGDAPGTIEIRTAVESSTRIPSVTISINDNGVGIPRDHLPNLFAPGFTTRDGASGLGLFIARRIAESNDGTNPNKPVAKLLLTMLIGDA